MDEKVTYQIDTTELNLQKMQFVVVNRRPIRTNASAKEKIEKELYQVFKKYA